MTLRGRLGRAEKRVGAVLPPAGPLTLFLVAGPPGCGTDARAVWGGAGREVAFDPAAGWPPLPPGGPHKLIACGSRGLTELV